MRWYTGATPIKRSGEILPIDLTLVFCHNFIKVVANPDNVNRYWNPAIIMISSLFARFQIHKAPKESRIRNASGMSEISSPNGMLGVQTVSAGCMWKPSVLKITVQAGVWSCSDVASVC